MTRNQIQIRCQPPDPDMFAPYGTFILPPKEPGQRSMYSAHLGPSGLGEPVFHTNHVRPSTLPLSVTKIERHPHAEQAFIPLDVAWYVVAVVPSTPTGAPIPEKTLAFLVPGSVGVIYRTGVWHLGATVLNRAGSFAVLMRRRGDESDDEFRQISAVTLHMQDHLAPAAR